MITLQEIFSFQQTGIDNEGKINGQFMFHGVRPRFTDKFKIAGIELPRGLFDPNRTVAI